MKEGKNLTILDDYIIRVLSLYQHLTPLQLWYELEEASDGTKRVSVEEIQRSLEYLREKGVVQGENGHWVLK